MGTSREYLIHLLSEAAEIEHNLMCSYLYAAFSLKTDGEGLRTGEGQAVARWRSQIVGVAIEEMGHLALVNNLLIAIGGAAHFDRPNLPVPPGYHPADFIIRLTPFSRDTLAHFIFLERPAEEPVEDGRVFRKKAAVEPTVIRTQTPGHLTPSTPDYETVGEFYAEIRSVLIAHAERHGDFAFVDVDAVGQIGPDIVDLPGLITITNLSEALQALDTIIEQGEGAASCAEDCHFARFRAIQREWDELEAANPRFLPAHPAAHDPVMRRPAEGLDRVWITAPVAARQLDLGNALYALALGLLAQAYAPATVPAGRKALMGGALALMHGLAVVGSALARLPSDDTGNLNGPHAGLTFAVPRSAQVRAQCAPFALMLERLEELRPAAAALFGSKLQPALDRATAVLSPSRKPSRP